MHHFFTASEVFHYESARGDLLADFTTKVSTYWRFYVGPLLSIPLISLLFCWRLRRVRLLLAMAAGFSFSLLPQVWHNPHYAAPATGLILLAVSMGLRTMQFSGWGRCYARILPLACAAMLLIQIAAGGGGEDTPSWQWPVYGGHERASLLRELEKTPGNHLVLVRYGRLHDVGNEWVYNGADIDGSKVLWARELDRGSNQRLIGYFKTRRVWLVEPDLADPRLIPYNQAAPRPMFFIPPGAPGIESLRSIDSLRSSLYSAARQTCDVWNYYFTELTGVYGPDPVKGCYDGGDRSQAVPFDRWFNWMLGMRE